MLVDSHCHLDFEDFGEDIDDVVARAGANGVGAMVTICTHLSRFAAVRAIAERYANIWCSVGVHPHQAGTEGQKKVDALVELADNPKVVGIGETGLDYYYERSPRESQRESFHAHIVAARQTGLPLIVHSRDADAEMADILRKEFAAGPFSGVMHCFSSSRTLAEVALSIGFYISFSGILTFKSADEVRAIAQDVPPDRLLVETDAPYLAPMPNRGKRNEPSFVVHTATQLAEVKGWNSADLAQQTTDNFYRLFSRAEPAA
jgi:TatD DNase family protein